VIWSKL